MQCREGNIKEETTSVDYSTDDPILVSSLRSCNSPARLMEPSKIRQGNASLAFRNSPSPFDTLIIDQIDLSI